MEPEKGIEIGHLKPFSASSISRWNPRKGLKLNVSASSYSTPSVWNPRKGLKSFKAIILIQHILSAVEPEKGIEI